MADLLDFDRNLSLLLLNGFFVIVSEDNKGFLRDLQFFNSFSLLLKFLFHILDVLAVGEFLPVLKFILVLLLLFLPHYFVPQKLSLNLFFSIVGFSHFFISLLQFFIRSGINIFHEVFVKFAFFYLILFYKFDVVTQVH
jgi:hypothetical protein